MGDSARTFKLSTVLCSVRVVLSLLFCRVVCLWYSAAVSVCRTVVFVFRVGALCEVTQCAQSAHSVP